MAYKTLIFGVDDLFNELKPYYAREVQSGNLEVVAFAVLEGGKVNLVPAEGIQGGGYLNFELAIISSRNDFYNRMKFLEAQGVPRNRIIDGRVFKVPNLDFPRLLKEGVAYGIFVGNNFSEFSYSIYPKVYTNGKMNLTFGNKSYIGNTVLEGNGTISVGKYSALSWSILFFLGSKTDHNYRNVNSYGITHLDWNTPKEFYPPQGTCKILIGNDVWVGRGCILKCTNPNKPLIIGDGAVIASDSVVVKNVPPYAIVGGNPAKIIKYRFPSYVIRALLRIKWWDWSLDKIHDNFKYFNDVERFIALHDR